MQRLLFCGFLFIAGFLFIESSAQSIDEQMTKTYPNCNDVYRNATNLLPKLYRENIIDSMYKAIRIWKAACGDIPEVKYTTILLSIDQSVFKDTSIDADLLSLLINYANGFYFNNQYRSAYAQQQNAFYKFSSIWAKLLLKQKTLGESEQLICKVFAGEIADPVFEIKSNRQKYPAFVALQKQKEAAERTGVRSNYSFILGNWMPTGDLTVVGNHPSIGFQLGGRDVYNQLDLTIQFRFLKSANTYLVRRNNILYESSSFFGGYIGMDYTRYLVSRQNFDFGVLAGMGFDGFDLFSSNNNNQHLRPLSVGSFNANTGLRYNYFLSPTFYIGLQGRYNWINYNNTGGTSFSGNALSFDLIFGSNASRNRLFTRH
jgi:hypothetical protein